MSSVHIILLSLGILSALTLIFTYDAYVTNAKKSGDKPTFDGYWESYTFGIKNSTIFVFCAPLLLALGSKISDMF